MTATPNKSQLMKFATLAHDKSDEFHNYGKMGDRWFLQAIQEAADECGLEIVRKNRTADLFGDRQSKRKAS